MELKSISLSDAGKVRTENQDSLLVDDAKGLYAVADGMGGGKGGALASKWICEDLKGAETLGAIRAALAKTDRRIKEFAAREGFKMMGSTVAFAAGSRFSGVADRLAVGWMGDSRVYKLSNGRLYALTSDHTIGNELSKAYPDAADLARRNNPLAHVLTHSIGTGDGFALSETATYVRHGDKLLLCSDGVHDLIQDGELACLLGKPDAVEAIAECVRERGAHDNFSMIVIEVSLESKH